MARFTAELELLSGRVIRAGESELGAHLIALLRARGVTRVQAWDEIERAHGEELRAAGIEIVSAHDPFIRAGVTGALAGIAETGTLVLPGGPGRPLTASLLPETHIAVLRARNLVCSLPEALALDGARSASAVALVSGPSRTADIEMTLTIGVHGPAELIVLLVEPEGA